jgi:hypothetical protein
MPDKSARIKWKGKAGKDKKTPGADLVPSSRSLSSTPHSNSSDPRQRRDEGTRHVRSWDDPGSDGYDAASEMGRGDLTDGMEDGTVSENESCFGSSTTAITTSGAAGRGGRNRFFSSSENSSRL